MDTGNRPHSMWHALWSNDGVIGNKIALLLIGSEKKDQDKAIAKATTYLADYEERAKE